MHKKSLLEKIRSKYTFQNIFTFIKGYNDNLPYKLFLYSKLFQNKLEIKLIDYQEKYFDKIKFLENYLLYTNSTSGKSGFSLKEELKNKLDKELLKYNIDNNKIQKLVINHFKIKQKEINNYSESIDFYSPFFDFLSKTEMFGKIFNISIFFDAIKEFNLNTEYREKFNNLNKLNIKYSSLDIKCNDYDNINALKSFKINFSQIKKLMLSIDTPYSSYIIFNIFSFDNIKNNLVSLSLNLCNNSQRIDSDILSQLNHFKSLKFLKLEEFRFYTPFILKLYNLQKLSVAYCSYIGFDSKSLLNLKSLSLRYCFIEGDDYLLKMPELEEISIWKSNLIIDFESLKKLKSFVGQIDYFLLLQNTLLDNVNINLNDNEIDYINIDAKLIEKLNEIKINNKLILKMNNSKDFDGILYKLQDKYPYLSNLTFKSIYDSSSFSIEKSLTMKDNLYNNNYGFILNIQYPKNINLYCKYEKLETICFILHEKINIKDIPIFNEKCKVKFNSLKEFSLSTYDGQIINFDIIQNLYNNIDKMPNLKGFEIKIDSNNVEEELYIAFIKKILSLKLIRRLIFIIKKHSSRNYYTKNEIKDLFPNLNLNNYYQITIQKFK